jgi:cytochrome c-type biogenesis protein CcmH
VTGFIIACAAMIAAALLWIVVPLLRTKSAEESKSRSERRISAIAIAVLVPALAAALYVTLSKWDWNGVAAQVAQGEQMDQLLQRLRAKLDENPNNVDGWLLLGKSYAKLERHALAVDAFQHAYDQSKGENIEAVLGLGEALALTDEASLQGKAGQLFEAALARGSHDPRALWYGGIVALQANNLRLGRDRFQQLLAMNPPPEVRGLLERQIQDLNQQLGEAGQGTPAATSGGEGTAAAAAKRSIKVAVTISPMDRVPG